MNLALKKKPEIGWSTPAPGPMAFYVLALLLTTCDLVAASDSSTNSAPLPQIPVETGSNAPVVKKITPPATNNVAVSQPPAMVPGEAAKSNSSPESVTAHAAAPVEPTNSLREKTAANSGATPPIESELGHLPTPAYLVTPKEPAPVEHLRDIQLLLELAREQRREKNYDNAVAMLIDIMQTNAPTEIKRPALFELALIAQDQGKFVKSQQIFAQYLQKYPDDPSTPEILLRQGLVYRQMGVDSLAISKFYAVMSSSLKLRLDNMDYYRKLVLQAQVEIADTHYLDGDYADAADFYMRLLKNGAPELNTALIQYKLIRSLSYQTNHFETAAKAQTYLDSYPNSADVPEVRFLLASCLKKLGRNQESMRQVLILLQSEQQRSSKNPETWIYWQQRAGNEIANQLYKEGDYLSSLQIYLSLADLNKTAEWQLPVWYQTAMVYEQLMQPQKATEIYINILGRKKEFTDTTPSPGLESLFEMAKWRKDYLDWLQKAKTASLEVKPAVINATNLPAPAALTNVLNSAASQ